ncbi:MAG: phytanoyl-CoA dioxygenase family protein [Pseudomonadota bacterium]|nr:phytanoyl-CoA dioxygenase family protein [Pseudomonadota bacterium]
MSGLLSAEETGFYVENGYLVVRGLFARDEVDLILDAAVSDDRLRQAAYSRTDTEGNETRMSVWDELDDDIYSIAMRTRRVVGRVEELIGEPVCHYNSKLNAKDAKVGGRWEWHQDYGYAYGYGVLAPQMATCFVSLDPSTRENGCIEMLAGSHKLGRIDHAFVGKQYCADMDRMKIAEERLAVATCELDAGDAVFFHCNTLHRSGANRSDRRRWALITVYNAVSNQPYKEGPHSGFHPVDMVEDDVLRTCVGRVSTASKRFQARAYNPAAA